MVFYKRSSKASGKETKQHNDHAIIRTCTRLTFVLTQVLSLVSVHSIQYMLLKQTACYVCVVSAGVSSLISLLTSAREEDQPRLNVLLCEAVVAVYLALLIHGLGTHNSNELFRLGAHPLNNRVWAAVFGGGARVIIKPKRPEAPPGRELLPFYFPAMRESSSFSIDPFKQPFQARVFLVCAV